MEAIWKFPFEVSDKVCIKMLVNAKILSVQVQYGTPCIWAICSDIELSSTIQEKRLFSIYGTGHQHSKIKGTFIGTFQMMEGSLVFHLFEEE